MRLSCRTTGVRIRSTYLSKPPRRLTSRAGAKLRVSGPDQLCRYPSKPVVFFFGLSVNIFSNIYLHKAKVQITGHLRLLEKPVTDYLIGCLGSLSEPKHSPASRRPFLWDNLAFKHPSVLFNLLNKSQHSKKIALAELAVAICSEGIRSDPRGYKYPTTPGGVCSELGLGQHSVTQSLHIFQ